MVSFKNDIESCLQTLNAGGLILYPTDTVWGIGCDATNATAVDKIYQLKRRPDKKTMIILTAEKKEIYKYVSSPAEKIFQFLERVAKPTTVIYSGAKALPHNLLNEDGSIAIRIVNDEFCTTLLEKFKKPIVSTSANISGNPTPGNFIEISEEIKNGVEYIVQHRQDDMKCYLSSSIIKLNEKGAIEIIR